MSSFWHIRRSWRRLIAWTLAVVITLGTLALSWFNWRSSLDWQTVHARLVASGEDKTFDQYVPAMPPEAQNFFAIPELKDLTLVVDNNPRAGHPALTRKHFAELGPETWFVENPSVPNLQFRDFGFDSLSTLRDYLYAASGCPVPADSSNAGRDILGIMDQTRPLMKPMIAAVHRPFAQFAVDRRGTRLTLNRSDAWTTPVRGVCDAANGFYVRARAALAAGDPRQAVDCVRVILHIAHAVAAEPCVIGSAAAAEVFSIANRATARLAITHQLPEGDLDRLQSELDKVDIEGWALRGCRQQMTMELETFDLIQSLPFYQRASKWREYTPAGYNPKTESPGWRDLAGEKMVNLGVLPQGMWDEAKTATTRLWLEYTIVPLQTGGLPAMGIALESTVDRQAASPDKPFVPWPSRAGWNHCQDLIKSILTSRVSRQQMQVILALEHHYRKHGAYPARLADLPPSPKLPLDQMKYTCIKGGKFELTSAGIDQRMDTMDDITTYYPDP